MPRVAIGSFRRPGENAENAEKCGAVSAVFEYNSSMLIDAGTYLQDTPDERVNRAILKQASAFKIGKFFCSGVSSEDWSLVDSLVRQEERIVPFFGIHPWYVDRVPFGWDKQLSHVLIMHHGAGIGAVGLDRSSNGGDYEKQKEVFLGHLKLAEQYGRPLAIHCVKAWDDLVIFLRGHKASHTRFMVHAYEGNPETLEQLLQMGAYISFSRKSLLLADSLIRALLRQVPKDRLLLETNFPYMHSNKVDAGFTVDMYFSCLKETYALAAQVLGSDVDDLADAIWDNSTKYLTGDIPKGQGSTKKR